MRNALVTTKVYERGGKVWTGINGQGLVFLEKDWENDRLPEDLVEEAGLLGTDFNLLKRFNGPNSPDTQSMEM
jgi:hypothetical protein